MKRNDALTERFIAGTLLPLRGVVLADPNLGASGRSLAEALFDRDIERARALLGSDPALARQPIADRQDMLSIAVAMLSIEAIDLLASNGAVLDGPALEIALAADDPAAALRLLQAGASATPRDNPLGPLRTAIANGSAGAVRMLLDMGGDVDAMGPTGTRPLHIALDMERFAIAELLLDRGADAWAIDATGGNLGTAVTTAMMTPSPDEEEAQARLARRALALGWPNPAPTPGAIRETALAGAWPPAGSRAPQVPTIVLECFADRARNGATVQ